jgi:triacylglycerol lipase
MTRKPLPAPSPDLLFHPERDAEYNYFENAASIPFAPNAPFSRANAWWLAEAALLAYSNEAKMREVYGRLGLQCDFLAAESTQCHLAWNETFVIVAFRGTQPDELNDSLDDAHLDQHSWPTGFVHAGFKDAFERVKDPLASTLGALKAGRTLWFTGHSLGAALATLAASAFDAHADSRVVTFGSPRVGSPAFASAFSARFSGRSLRYVNDTDIVTRVPPPVLVLPPAEYRHVDSLRFIAADGSVSGDGFSLLDAAADLVRSTQHLLDALDGIKSGRVDVLPDFLVDHTPRRYAVQVWNDLVAHGL